MAGEAHEIQGPVGERGEVGPQGPRGETGPGGGKNYWLDMGTFLYPTLM